MSHHAAVFFQLRFARPAHTNTALQPREVTPHAAKSRKRIFQLGKLHLEASLHGFGACGKNIQNQFAAVENLALSGLFKSPDLAWSQIVVKNNHVCFVRFTFLQKLLHFPGTDVST